MCENEPGQKEGAENMLPNRVKNFYEGFVNMYRTDRRVKCEKEKSFVKKIQEEDGNFKGHVLAT